MQFQVVFLTFCAALSVAGTAYAAAADTPDRGAMQRETIPTGFLNKTMNIDGQPRHYVLYVPREYTPDRPWPLIVFLHGMGERGSDGLAQTEVGIGSSIRFHPDWFPCLVVMPQCPGNVTWDKASAHIDTCINDTRNEYAVDPHRVYLTGLSMGGYAAWQYGAKNLRQFAAIMPICGGGKTEDAQKLAQIPIWAFHGAKDKTVPPKQSRRMVDAVKKAGGDVRYTEYPDLEHNSWDRAYADKEAIDWLLSQRKK